MVRGRITGPETNGLRPIPVSAKLQLKVAVEDIQRRHALRGRWSERAVELAAPQRRVIASQGA